MLELARVLEREPDSLRVYLHHRRLAGHGETFGKGLLEPLELPRREAAEADFLRRRLAELPEDAPERPSLAERLARLIDPAEAAGRLVDCVARTRQRLDRSLELLRQESLERTLDDVYRTYLGRLLGKPIRPGPLPEGTREALALLHAAHIDTGLLTGFLDDMLESRPLGDREVNRAWLERAQSAGIDTKAWLAGVNATVEVEGQRITFATEQDPLHVLRMGSYFETCLTLESGINAASTLMNALDVNKKVIYGRRADGTVVARKLIGATATGELAGYQTYSHNNPSAFREALHPILADFAHRCGLRLSDRATPEVLHKGFWYNDGNEVWMTTLSRLALPALPADAPQDVLAAGEWHLVEALRHQDTDRLAAVARRGGDEPGHAALFRLLLDPPAANEPPWVIGQDVNVEKLIAALTVRGSFHWLDRPAARLGPCKVSETLNLALTRLPFDAAVVGRAIRRLRQEASRGRDEDSLDHNRVLPGTACVLTGAAELIDLYVDSARLMCQQCMEGAASNEPFLRGWAQRLRMAWLRDRDARPLVRALERDTPGLVPILLELACQEVIPGLAPRLRTLLKQRDMPDVLALALGTQGEPADGPRLLEWLRQRPHSLPVALAVVRTGHAPSAQEARRSWRPLRNLPDDPVSVSRLRELASPGTVRCLRREIKDLARAIATPGCESSIDQAGLLRTRLTTLALLGQPGPEGEPATLLAPYAAERVFREECWWYEHDGPLLQQLWEDLRCRGEQTARLRAGEAAPLAWWAEVRQCAASQAVLRDEPFESILLHIVADRDDPRRVEALAAWIDLVQRSDGESIALVLGLLAEDLPRLPWSIRDRAAQALAATDLAGTLAWMRGRSWGQADGLLESSGQPVPRLSEQTAPIVLQALESSDPEEVRTARTVLDAHALRAPYDLLTVLDSAFFWLRPEVIEPLAEELARSLAIAELTVRQVDAWLLEPEHSYRWHRLLIEVVRPRFGDEDTTALEGSLSAATANLRAPWLLSLLSKQRESR
jgi:hypothetical protein